MISSGERWRQNQGSEKNQEKERDSFGHILLILQYTEADMSETLPSPSPDFHRIFEAVPGAYLILLPNAPTFTIVAVSDSYLQATMTVREEIVGKGLFAVFPDNPADVHATGVKNLTDSLNRVIANRKSDAMAIQKYDIPVPGSGGRVFEERHWSPHNYPVFGEGGEMINIIHTVIDVTKQVKLESEYTDSRDQLVVKVLELEKMTRVLAQNELQLFDLKKENEELKKQLVSRQA